MKERLLNALGTFGGILWWIISFIFALAPIAVLPLGAWRTVLFLAMLFIPFVGQLLQLGMYVWAFIYMINGPQDTLAIIFYVIFALYMLAILPDFLALVRAWLFKKS